MNICFCINNNYCQHASVAITSILLNTKESVNFFIFHKNLREDNIKILQKQIKSFRNTTVKFLQITPKLTENIITTIDYISIETYFRFFIPDLLSNINKVIYLDADIIVNKNIKELWDIDVSKHLIAGVHDSYIESINYKNKIGLQDSDPYINAGVLVMNLQDLRNQGYTKKLLDAIHRLQHKISFMDQDILNIVLKSKIKLIETKFNYATHNAVDCTKKDLVNIVIFHFTGNVKPWDKYLSSPNPNDYLYFNYLKYSPFRKQFWRFIVGNFSKFVYHKRKTNHLRFVNILGTTFIFNREKQK